METDVTEPMNAVKILTQPLSREACSEHPVAGEPHCWHRPALQPDLKQYEYFTCCWCSESQVMQHGSYRVEER